VTSSLSTTLRSPSIPLLEGGAGVQIVADEQTKAMRFAVLKAKGEIVPLTPKNTGLSAKSIATELLGVKVDLVGRIFSPLGHMLPLEVGARWKGKQPPTEPLRLWAERKFGVDEGEARSIAFAVARNLKRFGLVSRRMFSGGYKLAKPAITARWETALATIKARLLKAGEIR
jgi:hypothetical protein